MKLLNFCCALFIHGGVFQMCLGGNLNCELRDIEFDIGTFYACVVTSLDNSNNSFVITKHSGVHNAYKNDIDVKEIYIHDTNTKFIPTDLGILFNLKVLIMQNTKLIAIKSQDFKGMENLEILSLFDNRLTSLPIDAFSTLNKLKLISLRDNLINEIPNEAFSNNIQLETIRLYNNKIKFLGSSSFSGLTKLNYVYLSGNICINKDYTGRTAIIELMNDIKIRCNIPNDVIAFEMNKLVSSSFCSEQKQPQDQTQVEKQKSELHQIKTILLEVVEQQQKNAIEIEKMNTKLTKVQQDLDEAKTFQLMQQNKLINLERKPSALNKDISATNNIRQLEQTIVIETKINFLKENEQLYNCTKDELIDL